MFLRPHAISIVSILLGSVGMLASPKPAHPAEPFAKVGVDFLSKHCTSCHGPQKQKADLTLHQFKDDSSLVKNRKKWRRILEAVREGDMPPEDKPQPSQAERDAFLASAEAVFSNFAANSKPDPGRVTVRRLNRNEYNNTVRDLFGVDTKPASDFPADGVGYGFDNIGDVLSMSPLLMERMLDTAQYVAEAAIPVHLRPVPVRRVPARELLPKDDRPEAPNSKGGWRELPDSGLPLFLPFAAAPSESYTLRIAAWTDAPASQTVRMAVLAGGNDITDPEPPERVALLHVGNAIKKKIRILETPELKARNPAEPQIIDVKLKSIAGVEGVALDMLKGPEQRPKVYVRGIEIAGPEDTRTPFMRRWGDIGRNNPPGQRTRAILAEIMPRAWHRPVTQDEIERVALLADAAIQRQESWEASMRLALTAVLSSPKFIFRLETDDQPDNPGPHPITEFQLATRLSYFLWSSCPDDELLDAARNNRLTPDLGKHVQRMLSDPRATALVDNFAMQWLQLRRLANHQADRSVFPNWQASLRDSMLTETQLFIREIIQQDRSILDLLDADFTYLDRNLAAIYNIWPQGGFDGDKFRRVSLTDAQAKSRGGLLTQASVLTVTSNPTRTSPVKRGKWILEQLLGDPPPPPPQVVPSLDDQNRKELSGTFRQRLEQNRADPKCANCHAKMDVLGFALENFDAIGQWRDRNELGQPVDVGGKLPKGPELKTLADFKGLLRSQKDQFARCLIEKMLTYALGRGLEYYDEPAIDKIQAEVSRNGYKFSELAIAIANSDPFRMRRGKTQQSQH